MGLSLGSASPSGLSQAGPPPPVSPHLESEASVALSSPWSCHEDKDNEHVLQTHPCECAFTMLANTTSGPPPSLEEAARKTSPPSLYSFAPWRYVFEICCCVFGLLRAGLVVLDVRCCGNLCDRQRAQEAWRPQSPAWRVGGGNLGRALAGVLQQPGSRWGSALWGSSHSGWGGCGAPASGACV